MVLKLKKKETPVSLAETYLGSVKKAWIIEDANKGTFYQKGENVIIPIRLINMGGITAEGYQTVPILGYRRIDHQCAGSSCVTPDIFEQQMKYLKDHGYHVITMMDLLDFLNYKTALPAKSLVVTIEDRPIVAQNAVVQILNKYGFPATFFLNVASMDHDQNPMAWNLAKALKAGGFEVGLQIPASDNILQKKDNEDVSSHMARIKEMLSRLKKVMDTKLSQDTICLALPTDEDNTFLMNICDQVGYKIVVSRQEGSNPFFADPLALKTNSISGQDTGTFIAKLKTFQAAPLR
ncbi:MAG: polysaccharide deacetylase family protein [Deltaproteobacteria bacterium]|nr:polysaccharide deacetylase family protein [Deltaproteobacteria bacterium]